MTCERKRAAKAGSKSKTAYTTARGTPAGEGGSGSGSGVKEEDDHHATLVVTTSKDDFSLKQDMCKSCGSYGRDAEGRLISCVQCGQCYHTFCAGVKVSGPVGIIKLLWVLTPV